MLLLGMIYKYILDEMGLGAVSTLYGTSIYFQKRYWVEQYSLY